MASEIFVKVVRTPGAVREISVSNNATVADVLRAAGMSLSSSERVTVDGCSASPTTCVTDGARVIVAKEAKSA